MSIHVQVRDNSWCSSSSTYIHVSVPANYDEIWGNKIITSGFKLLLLLAHSTVCWWCSWRKYKICITPKRFLIFCIRPWWTWRAPPSHLPSSLQENKNLFIATKILWGSRALLVNQLASNPESNSVPNYNHTLILSPRLSYWEDFLVHLAVKPSSWNTPTLFLN